MTQRTFKSVFGDWVGTFIVTTLLAYFATGFVQSDGLITLFWAAITAVLTIFTCIFATVTIARTAQYATQVTAES